MKKVLVTILALVYISTSTGAVLHMHYCMGKMVDWGLFDNDSNECSKCGMVEENNGCCKDEHKFIKNDTDQKTPKAGFQLIQLLAVALPVCYIEIPSNDFPSIIEENPISHAPPRSSGVAVYIRNCVFLI